MMPLHLRFYSLLALMLLSCFPLNSQIITIGDNGDFPNLEAAATSISAGDTLLLESQIFDDGTQFLNNLKGTSTAPIVILAETEHEAIFRGGTEAIHLIDCSYVEINGVVVEQQSGSNS